MNLDVPHKKYNVIFRSSVAIILSFAVINLHAESTVLIIKKYIANIDGKSTELFKIEQPDGTWGYHGIRGQMFDAIVKNHTDKPTALHWHGLIVPNNQDGVPHVTQAPIPPGGEYHYRFLLKQSGTYWMHSHHDLQLQQLLAAPFIIDEPHTTHRTKDVVVFISDFSYRKPEVILKQLKQGNMMMHMDMNMHHHMPADLNDVKYDAFLTNYTTLKHPEIVSVKEGEQVRLRFIIGSAMTNFFINLGELQGTAIAIDGQPIQAFKSSKFQLAVGQRLDVLVIIPKTAQFYPILAQGEGTSMQTGVILATKHAKIPVFKESANSLAGALDYTQELQFKALQPLKPQKPQQTLTINLEGDMMSYTWSINKQIWPKIKAIQLLNHRRVEMVFNNKTSMAHPMHLHGHVFEVIAIDGKKIKRGLMHDTVIVLPNSTVTVQFDTDNPGKWMLHCHMLYHQASGMMTLVDY